jgi:hypothetical protein
MGVENNVVTPGSFTKTGHYIGFMWQICVYAYCVPDFGGLIGGPGGENECKICPSDQEDLIDCEWNEYRDPETGSCEPCRADCP